MSKAWMPLYVADYLADTTHLTAAQSGAYLHLIMHYWQHDGDLPDDDQKLAMIARMRIEDWRRNRPTIEAFFQPGWVHLRVDYELARAADLSQKRRAAGKKRGGPTPENPDVAPPGTTRSRSGKNINKINEGTSAIGELLQTQSQSQSQREKERASSLRSDSHTRTALTVVPRKPSDDTDSGFEEFWKQYPRRVARGAALKAYRAAVKKAAPADILEGAGRYAAERTGEDQTYTKHPATWLNGECWRDQPGGSGGPGAPASDRSPMSPALQTLFNMLPPKVGTNG